MKRWQVWTAVAAAAGLLAACGGGRDDPAPVRGGVIAVDAFGSFTQAQVDAGTAAAGTGAITGPAGCDVIVQRLRYQTQAPGGAFATASTAVMVPSGTAAGCTGTRPVLLYAHGTTTTKSFNMAAVASNGEASLVMAMFAAQGYIVVAPNYLGYDTSSLNYHPYLNAEAQALDMIDGLRAARAYLNTSSATRPSGQLFISGYSQGGHVAMATHKVLERDHAGEFTVTASGPMSGPYNLVGLSDAVTLGQAPVNGGATIFLPLLTTSYQRAYGNVYSTPADVYQAPWAATVETLFPTDTPLAELITPPNNKLPADPTFTRLFGTGGLITDAFRTAYPTSNYRQAVLTNTLVGTNGLANNAVITWTPKAPVAMCGGANDPTVFFAPNGPVVANIWRSTNVTIPDLSRNMPAYVSYDLESRATLPQPPATVGVPAVPLAQVTPTTVLTPADAAAIVLSAGRLPTDPAGTFRAPGADQIFAGFAAAKTAAGANLQARYHGELVPPFCSALVRGFFALRQADLQTPRQP
jgi:hypothetical protein